MRPGVRGKAGKVRRRDLLAILGRLRAFFESLAIPDPALARIAGQFEILSEFESVGGTSVFAKAAEHAAAQIISKVCKFLAASFFIALAGDHDKVFGACQRTEIAGNAHRLVGIGIDVETRGAAISLGDLWPFQRILLGVDFLRVLIAKRDAQTLQQIDEKNFAEQAWHPHNGLAYH